MTVIGITGPTGSGKTTTLEELKKRNFQVVDCDRLYYELLREDASLRQKLTDTFGPVFLPDGQLDRAALSAKVFGDQKELDKLNRIVYPAVRSGVERKMAACSKSGFVIDAINLIESGLGELCDYTIGITAPPEVRLKRIMARDNISQERAEARIKAQKADKFYRKNCTFLLENRAGSKSEFQRLISEFLENILFDMEE